MPVAAAVVVFKCWSADTFAFHWPWFFPSVNIVHSSRLAAQVLYTKYLAPFAMEMVELLLHYLQKAWLVICQANCYKQQETVPLSPQNTSPAGS